MTDFRRRVVTAIATSALLLNTFTSVALADTSLEISTNGSNSDNDVTVTMDSSTTVVQSNNAQISNNVNVDADTGHNDANDNTGGDVSIETGDAQSKVDVSTTANSNSANVDCCPGGDTKVLISENGTHSDNTVDLDKTSDTVLFQDNWADIHNDVDVDADTGHNDANDNTGGDVSIETGDAEVDVNVSTTANSNWAQVGGDDNNGSVTAHIIGNGSNSDNEIDLDLDRSVLLVQSNSAWVWNSVDVDADTGHNDANDNTGGDVSIETGDADAKVEVDNAVNFNWADVDCGCLLDNLTAKIAKNGTYSDNTINAHLSDALDVFQGEDAGNWADLYNWVSVDPDTGHNDAEDNTGPGHHDPVEIMTGDADADVEVSNSANVNVFGQPLELPGDFLDFDFDFSFSLDLSDLLALLGLLA